MATWPASLPQVALIQGYATQRRDQRLMSETEVGPPKMRRRTTARVIDVVCNYAMSEAQLVTLDGFFVNDCRDGSLPFDGPDPRTGTGVYRFRWAEPPRTTPNGKKGWWNVACKLEIIPS